MFSTKISLLLLFAILIIHLNSNRLNISFLQNEDESIESIKQDDKVAFTVNDLHKLRRLQGKTVSSQIGDYRYIVLQLQDWEPKLDEPGVVNTKLYYLRVKIGSDEKIEEKRLEIDGQSPLFSGKRLYYLKRVNVEEGEANEKFSNLFYIDFEDFISTNIIKEVQITSYLIDIDGYKVSTKGNIIFSSKVYPESATIKDTYTKRKEFLSRGDDTYQEYDQIMANHWDEWNDGTVNNVFYLSVLDGNTKKEPVNLLNKLKLNPANSPVPPFGGDDHFDISPNGEYVSFTYASRVDEAVDTVWINKLVNVVNDKYDVVIEFEESGIEGRKQNPLFVNDNLLSYTAMPRKYLESDYTYLVFYDIQAKRTRHLTKKFTYSVSSFTIFNEDNNKLLFNSDYNGQTELFLVDLDKVENLNEDQFIPLTDVSDAYSKDVPLFFDKINSKTVGYLFVNGDLSPHRLVRAEFNLDNSSFVYEEVYNPNDFFDKKFILPSKNERLIFESANLKNTQGWVIKPINYDENKKYPIAFLIHGGPEGSWGNDWNTRWNPLLWSSKGYFTVMINPEGSTGKGQNFVDLVRDNWGSHPYNTLKAGFKAFINKYPNADKSKACAAGASFGGYSVNWIQGMQNKEKDPDFQFQCLVTHDGVFSTLAMFYITDEMWFPLAEYCPYESIGKCTPYDQKFRNHFLKYSPDTLVEYWSTPHLIIHGSNDLRIPVSEGIGAFTALQLRGVPSKFLHFEKENHWVLKRENSIAWYENVLGWFDKYTK